MKKTIRFFLIAISIAMLIPVLNSCKKGEEDPSLSFYSRKHRLCQDWDFSYFKRIEEHNNVITSYEFDGAGAILRKIVGLDLYVYNATMKISFTKDGTYNWNQTITTDTSKYTYYEEGSWYFTGGGKNSDTKYKELLALQKNKVTETMQITGVPPTTTNYYSSGNVDASVYEIIKLAYDEVKLKSKVQTDFVQNSPSLTDTKLLTIEFNLKKNL